MRLHLAKHIVPAMNQSGNILEASKSLDDTTPMSPSKKRRRSYSSSSVPAKDLKKIYKKIEETINVQLLLMERLEHLVLVLTLDDQQVLLLTNGVLPSLEIDCSSTSNGKLVQVAQQLQLAAISIMTAAFRKYPSQRDTVLEDLFPVILKLPTGKRSMRVFPVRYASATNPSGLEAMNSVLTRALLIQGERKPHLIQMMTALVISLVQACVTLPVFASTNHEEGEQKDESGVGKLQSGLRENHSIADSFVAQLLKRCTRQKTGGASEYRPFLANMIEDLLLVLVVPEYPAAELLISAFQRRLNEDLMKASSAFYNNQQQSQQFEATYLNAAFDAMGKICAFQARVLAAARERPLQMNADVPMSDTSDKEIDCHCKSKHTNVILLPCDQCNSVFHGPCVGFLDKESCPDADWFCDGCCLGKIRSREFSKYSDYEIDYLDKNFVMHYSFQAATSHRFGLAMTDAVRMHLARWIDQLERKRLDDNNMNVLPRMIVARLLEYWGKPGPAAEPLTGEGSLRVILCLLAETSTFFLSFRDQIGILLKIMGDPNTHSLRKLSLKAIEKVVEGDKGLMLLPVITKAVSRRLSDESISVREAAVSLVGSYVIKSPVAMKRYHSALLPCLTDVGVSVRLLLCDVGALDIESLLPFLTSDTFNVVN
jgi:cohesin loading factor subunit SCC2